MRLCDWSAVTYCAIVATLCVARASAVPHWWAFAAAHAAVAAGIVALVRFERPGWRAFLRKWDGIAYIPLLFFLAMRIVHHVNPRDWDDVLMRWDRAIGGLDLLRAMVSIERPWLTGAMKLAWMSYYFLPLAMALSLRRDDAAFREAKDALVGGWLVTFMFYFAMPALGPGWFQRELDLPQPKWEAGVISDGAKKIIDAVEPPQPRETFLPRHTFPSGHAMVAVLVSWYVLRNRRWSAAAAVVPLALGVLASTIYLRYHYVVDVLGGLVLAAAFVLIARRRAPTLAPRDETVH